MRNNSIKLNSILNKNNKNAIQNTPNDIYKNNLLGGYIFSIMLRKFLGDFSQVVYCFQNDTIMGTGDYMCGTIYLWMHRTFPEICKLNLMCEDSTDLQLKYFGDVYDKKQGGKLIKPQFRSRTL